MSKIELIKAREILDSRGNPTIEVDVYTQSGSFGRASVPSGASTGSKEAVELRDNDNRYLGKGVQKAVLNVEHVIAPKLIGVNVINQKEIDSIMLKLDGSKNKENLGANAILAVSLACLKAAANYNNVALYKYLGNQYQMPRAMMNIINGGAHANNKLDFQEFMIIPESPSFKQRLQIGAEVFHHLKKVLNENGFQTSVGDEGGFAPNLATNEEALDYIIKAIENAGYKPGRDVYLALDVAASEFYVADKDAYYLSGSDIYLTTDELINYYEKLINLYPIISIEDPLQEGDFDGFAKIMQKMGNKIQIVGDDLYVTSKDLLEKGVEKRSTNAILIKPNQIGTVTETLETIEFAKKNDIKTIISHRSGETEDVTISHLAVGLSLGQIKTGSLSRTDRVCKYNELLRIAEEEKL